MTSKILFPLFRVTYENFVAFALLTSFWRLRTHGRQPLQQSSLQENVTQPVQRSECTLLALRATKGKRADTTGATTRFGVRFAEVHVANNAWFWHLKWQLRRAELFRAPRASVGLSCLPRVDALAFLMGTLFPYAHN